MRTRRLLAPALLAVPLLAGCSLLTPITAPDLTPDGPVAVGSCLDGMNGQDSDRTSIVVCTEPHLYEVTGIEDWPGMAALLAGKDPGKVWDSVHLTDGTGEGATYIAWASQECQNSALDVLKLNQVSVGGTSTSKLRLTAGGGYGIDLSLGSRDEFVAGDHRTVCSVAWYDEDGPQKVVDPAGIGFAGYLGPGVPISKRECWDSDGYVVSCARPHAVQVLAEFDGLNAYDPEILKRSYDDEMTDDDYDVTDTFCHDLLSQLLPAGAIDETLGYLAEPSIGYGWDDWDGEVDPDGGYFFDCLLAPADPGALITGDVFEGTAAIAGDSA